MLAFNRPQSKNALGKNLMVQVSKIRGKIFRVEKQRVYVHVWVK